MRDQAGATLIELLVVLAIAAAVTWPLLGVLSGGWQAQAESAARARLQEDAARALQAVLRGEARGSDRIAGLVHAAAACASPDAGCRAGLVILALEPTVNQVVHFYLDGGVLYRRVCHLDPAGGCPADRLAPGPGAAPLLAGVAAFAAERIASDPPLYRLSLTVKGGPAARSPFTLEAVAGPRNSRRAGGA